MSHGRLDGGLAGDAGRALSATTSSPGSDQAAQPQLLITVAKLVLMSSTSQIF